MNNYLNRLLTICLLCLCLILLGQKSTLANNQTVVLGFWNLHMEEFRKSNDFYDKIDRESDQSWPGLSPGQYLEWYLWGSQGIGFLYTAILSPYDYHMTDSVDSPFSNQRYTAKESGLMFKSKFSFMIKNFLFTFPRIWWGENSYFRLGTVVGAGLSKYILIQDGRGYYGGVAWTPGLGITVGGFLDWGGDGFGSRLGVRGVSAWYKDLEYGGHKLNVDTMYYSAYLDLRWAW